MIVKIRVLNDKIPNSLVNIKTTFKSISFKFLVVIVINAFISLSISAQNTQTFKAKNGDGIYSILKKHGIPLSQFDEFIRLNQSKLGRNNELLIGVTYSLPFVDSIAYQLNDTTSETQTGQDSNAPSSNVVTNKIFGSTYENVEIISNVLKGAIYYLDAGHGGPDPGAVAHFNGKTLCEDEYAYDITLRLARLLIAQGATVYMINLDNNDGIRDGWYLKPDKDERCYPDLTMPINQIARLKQRKDAVNQLYLQYKGSYQRLVVIHVDSRSKGEKIDVFFYYDSRSKTGKKLANNLRNTFDTKYNTHQPGRGYHGTISDRDLYMLKHSWPVATFIELGNINHQRDLQRFIIDDNRQALAKWLSEGFVLDFKNNR